MNRLAVLLAAACLLALAGTAAAQINTAEISVIVADAQGVPLPGVTVEVTQAETGLTRSAPTDENGGARIAALPPGSYAMKFALAGFNPLEQTIVLRVGQVARLTATMTQVTGEAITVAGEAPIVDVTKMDSSTNILPEQIADLPVPSREFEKLAFIAPGVARERGEFRFIGGGPVLGGAGNASQSTIMVDGVDLTDPALGLARARFSQDAIREFRVIKSRFDTEIGGSAGGALSVVTKSGTNELAGSLFAFFRDDSLREPGALEQDSLPYQRVQYGFTVGGPIARDKTHYFLSGEYIDEENISLFRPGGQFVALAEDVPHPFTQLLTFGSLNHSISDSSNLSARFVYEKYQEDNFRVGANGGVRDLSNGMEVNRDNWNLTLEHIIVPSSSFINELRLQIGRRKYDEPANSTDLGEWFSSGNTLRTGNNEIADLLGEDDIYELRDTARFYKGNHELKAGFSVMRLRELFDLPVFQYGLLIYVTDTRALPLGYNYAEGPGDAEIWNTLVGAFVQDDWRVKPNLTLSLGLRYDYDRSGNNSDFEHSLTGARERDTNNFQPRLGFTWDLSGTGSSVLRGGAGRFTGRYLLVPALTELQQNGESGRVILTRVNGALFWPLCPSLGITDPAVCRAVFPALNPANPANTGILQKKNSALLEDSLEAPEADQVTLGFTQRLGQSRLYLDLEGIWLKGDNEITLRDANFSGNEAIAGGAPARPNSAWSQINTYTNEGHSEYKALVLALNGMLGGGHLITASVTWADKQNISDDFSPEFPIGYPSDPSDIEAEYGNARSWEQYRFVASGVFRLPWNMIIAPIYEYGSGFAWNHRLGYDYNGDGKNSDRPEGVERNSEDGPSFSSFNLRVTQAFTLGGTRLELIVEGFNLLDTTNYNVNSVDSAEFLSGPTLLNPALPYAANPNFGRYTATFPGREIQLGLRFVF